MCGITAIFCRESVPDYKHLDMLFAGTEQRGQDGFGIVKIKNTSKGRRLICASRSDKKYSDCKDDVKDALMKDPIQIGDVIMAVSRAAPETEGNTDADRMIETMQPIVNLKEKLAVVHNGSVSAKIHKELKEWADESGKYQFHSEVDSESILSAYIKYGRNMKNAMEYLSGGFAFIMFDESKDCLYMVNDHLQLSQSYIRGVGYMIHSELDVLRDIIFDVTGCSKDGVNIWENYYAHYMDGHAIRKIDLQSGCMEKIPYRVRYLTPTFDTVSGIIKPPPPKCRRIPEGSDKPIN